VPKEDKKLSVKPIRTPCIKLPKYKSAPKIAKKDKPVKNGPQILCNKTLSTSSSKSLRPLKGII